MDFNIEHLFHTYGPQYFPWVVLLCAMVENDVTFLVAGMFAASIHPHLSVVEAVACGVAGALCHDSFWFYVGRNRAVWIRKTAAWKRLGPQIEAWAQRFGQRELFLCRFIPGTRNASLIFWGVQRMKLPVFFGIEIASLALWGTVLTSIGFWFSKQAQALLGKVHKHHLGRWTLLALVVTAVVYYSVRAYTRNQIQKHGRPPEDVRAD